MRHARLLVAVAAALCVAPPCLGQMSYDGGMVVRGDPRVIMVVWGRQWRSDPAGEVRTMTRFYAGLGTGHDRWSRVLGEYGVSYSRHVLVARVWDTGTPLSATLSESQLAAEAGRIAVRLHAGPTTQIVVMTPHGVAPAGFPVQMCGSHGIATNGSVYVVLPYASDAGTACGGPAGVTVVASHEFAEAVTDPDTLGWSGSGFEIADLCELGPPGRLVTATGTYPVAALWSNRVRGCVTQESAPTSVHVPLPAVAGHHRRAATAA